MLSVASCYVKEVSISETWVMTQMEDGRAWVPQVTVAERPYAVPQVEAQEVAREVSKIAPEKVNPPCAQCQGQNRGRDHPGSTGVDQRKNPGAVPRMHIAGAADKGNCGGESVRASKEIIDVLVPHVTQGMTEVAKTMPQERTQSCTDLLR